jgi:uncharacterized protein YyaL (SSP411 family)
MPAVSWLPWSVDAFERARAERRPVLLSIVTSWSQSCREMDDTTYADDVVVRTIEESFVPVRVDADRQPDISDRYSLGGWPTTAFLTADGALAGGGTFVSRERMTSVLQKAAQAFTDKAAEIANVSATDSRRTGLTRAAAPSEAEMLAATYGTFDQEFGGFGTTPKFPLPAPIHLALELVRDHQDDNARRIATATLEAMGWSPLYDEGDGGFFRCADGRNWSRPHREKLLDVNAALIGLYVAASQVLSSDRYADRAHDALRYAHNWLADQVDGGWGNAQQDDREYYDAQAAAFDGRRIRPAVDHSRYSAANGAMISATLAAARAFDDTTLGTFAIASLERLLTTCYRPAQGVSHVVDAAGRRSGLLDDQVTVAAACLDAYDSTSNIVYEMMAEELMKHAMRLMWDDAHNLFRDRSAPDAHEEIGLMRVPLLPFVTNCSAASVLFRLTATSGDHEFAERAGVVLESLGGMAAEQGPQAAHYLLALRASRLR